ncbi:MAG: glycosyltransferase family A protein [Candidatus Bathyarchaeales archaeon]
MHLSIIIPAYGRPEDLYNLLCCIKRQSVKPLEVIVVDDTPSSVVEVLCEQMKSQLKESEIELLYLRNPKEPSSATARNIGAEVAKGDIVLFFDSDIIPLENYIKNVLEVFENHPHVLGVQGFEIRKKINRPYSLPIFLWHQFLRKIFFLSILTQDSCRLFEYPIILTHTLNCEWLAGSNMAWKKEVFSEFSFDENLKSYAYMEDVLFSHSVFQKYPNSLLITPKAKCIHKLSKAARMTNREFKKHERIYRKYVLTKLFGLKGLYIYSMQNFGALLISLTRKIRISVKK